MNRPTAMTMNSSVLCITFEEKVLHLVAGTENCIRSVLNSAVTTRSRLLSCSSQSGQFRAKLTMETGRYSVLLSQLLQDGWTVQSALEKTLLFVRQEYRETENPVSILCVRPSAPAKIHLEDSSTQEIIAVRACLQLHCKRGIKKEEVDQQLRKHTFILFGKPFENSEGAVLLQSIVQCLRARQYRLVAPINGTLYFHQDTSSPVTSPKSMFTMSLHQQSGALTLTNADEKTQKVIEKAMQSHRSQIRDLVDILQRLSLQGWRVATCLQIRGAANLSTLVMEKYPPACVLHFGTQIGKNKEINKLVEAPSTLMRPSSLEKLTNASTEEMLLQLEDSGWHVAATLNSKQAIFCRNEREIDMCSCDDYLESLFRM